MANLTRTIVLYHKNRTIANPKKILLQNFLRNLLAKLITPGTKPSNEGTITGTVRVDCDNDKGSLVGRFQMSWQLDRDFTVDDYDLIDTWLNSNLWSVLPDGVSGDDNIAWIP